MKDITLRQKRIFFSFISVLLIIVLILPSCAGSGTPEETTAPVDTEENLWLDSLPDDLDFDGEKLIMIAELGLWKPAEDQKEVVSAAQTNMYNNVCERLDIGIEYLDLPNPNPNDWYGDMHNLERNTLSQMYEFDLITSRGYATAPLAMEGCVINLTNAEYFDYIELDKPWWKDDFYEALSIRDYHYWLAGMATAASVSGVFSIFFNSEMMKVTQGEDYNIYNTVREGKWTLDTLLELSRDALKDDGNGETDRNDQFGFNVYERYNFKNLAICAGADYTKRDDTNEPYININTERNININEKLYDLINDPSYSPYAGGEDEGSYFGEGRLLMLCAPLYWAAGRFRSTEFDFGLIPMPKLNEDQEDYLTTLMEYWCVTGVPATAMPSRYQLTFAVADAMAAEAYRLYRPAYLDEAMKNKYSRDEDTKEMIDLIHSHITTDFLLLYGNDNHINDMFSETARDISSNIARKEKAYKKVLDNYISAFEEFSE